MPRALALPVVLAALLLGATGYTGEIVGSGSAHAQAQQVLSIKGELASRAKIALPPDSTVLIELRDAASPDAAAIAESRFPLQGKQAPIPFSLAVDRTKLVAGRTYKLHGSIISGGRAKWAGQSAAINPATAAVDAGQLALHQLKAEDIPAALRCGDHQVAIVQTPTGIQLTVGRERFDMRAVSASSGAKFEAIGDRSTTFSNKAHGASMVLHGRGLPPCARADHKATAFRGKGNDPAWWLDIGERTLRFLTDNNATRIEGPTPVAAVAGGTRRYVLQVEGHDLAVAIVERTCSDSKNAMPFPSEVAIQLDRRQLKGCGGDPAIFLQGREWAIETINAARPADKSRPTVKFEADGRMVGETGCNSYVGRYALTTEALTISGLATTRKACEAALAAQEKAVLDTLAAVQRFEIRPDGGLVLRAGDGRSIAGRRP